MAKDRKPIKKNPPPKKDTKPDKGPSKKKPNTIDRPSPNK